MVLTLEKYILAEPNLTQNIHFVLLKQGAMVLMKEVNYYYLKEMILPMTMVLIE